MCHAKGTASPWASDAGARDVQMSGITRHNDSTDHRAAVKSAEYARTASASDELVWIDGVSEEEGDASVDVSDQDKILFRTVYQVASCEMASTHVNDILDLQRMNGLNVQYKNLSWDSITDIQRSISHALVTEVVRDLNRANSYGLMVDESTDITVEKHLCVCV